MPFSFLPRFSCGSAPPDKKAGVRTPPSNMVLLKPLRGQLLPCTSLVKVTWPPLSDRWTISVFLHMPLACRVWLSPPRRESACVTSPADFLKMFSYTLPPATFSYEVIKGASTSGPGLGLCTACSATYIVARGDVTEPLHQDIV